MFLSMEYLASLLSLAVDPHAYQSGLRSGKEIHHHVSTIGAIWTYLQFNFGMPIGCRVKVHLEFPSVPDASILRHTAGFSELRAVSGPPVNECVCKRMLVLSRSNDS
jgi:hypothetical protein